MMRIWKRALAIVLALALVLSPLVATNIILAEYVGTHQIRVEIQIVIHNSCKLMDN